ncbi:MAG: T9SS type A sorting domain-containing protein [Aureispira sp.]|nr:T9SS type A sorting domain-containing protein [Aureispira sp.]
MKSQSWVDKMQDRSVNFYNTQQDFETAWGNRPYVRGNGWKQFKRWESFWEPRVFPHGMRPPGDYTWKEHLRFQRTYPATNSGARNASWTPMGPYSWTTSSYNPGAGRINAVAEDPNDANILYVGAPAGGCWKSTDAGATWTVLTDDLQSLGVSAIAVDYANSDVIYIGTGDDDGSDTYSIGLLKSIDGGATWADVTPASSSIFGAQIYRIIIHPVDHNTLFIASSTGCHKSIDGGATWTLLRAGNWRDMELKPGNPNTIYIANNTVYVTTNGGTSWTLVTVGLPSAGDINRAEIAVTAANPDYVYFVCGDGSNSSFYGLYRSTNSGASFTLQSNTPNIFAYDEAGAGGSGQSWYDMALAVSPTNAEEIYIGGINVWKSTDGGVTYEIKSHWFYPPSVGYTHADIHVLEMVGNRLYCGSDGGIFKSTNGGNGFADLSDGLSIMQFYRIGGSEQVPHKIIGGTQDNGCNLINNEVALHTNGGDGMEALISSVDSMVMYTSSQYGNFRRSDDGGYNFSGIFPTASGSGAWVTPLVMNPQDNDMLLAGFDEVYLTLDKGSSDSPISSFGQGVQLRNLAIAPSDGYTHFYASTYNQIYGTINSGSNWVDITGGLPSSAISSITVHPTQPLKVWVTFSGVQIGEKVYVSENGGTTWTNVSGNLPNIPVNCLIYQTGSADGIYIGTDVGIYYTDSLLAGWQYYSTGLPNVIVNDLEINYGIGKIRAGTYGRGLWESPIKQPVTTPPTANFAFSNSQICTTDSIEFSDASIDHAPSWIWHFPGGNPSTSTAQNPKVVYPTMGVYNVTLIVQNMNGVDSVTKSVPVSYQPNTLNLSIQLDNTPIDVSWELIENAGSVVYESPMFFLGNQPNQLINKPICLDQGCYTLVMKDLASNGLCCANGSGYYLLTDVNGDTLAFGTSYGNTDSTVFCVNQATPLVAGALITPTTCGLADGEISVTALGGDGNFLYSFNGGSYDPTSVFDNLSAGTYTINVQDGLGVITAITAVVSNANVPTAVASASATTVYLNQGGLADFFSTNSLNGASYSWTFPDGTTSTQADPNFTFTTDGLQDVILTVSNGACSDSDTLSITVVNNVNVTEIENNATITVSPNPIKDKFLLDIGFLQTQEKVEIVIHNALGQQVFWQELSQVKAYTQQIHFGNEPSGVYVVTVFSKDMAVSKKFVKG